MDAVSTEARDRLEEWWIRRYDHTRIYGDAMERAKVMYQEDKALRDDLHRILIETEPRQQEDK